MIKIKAPQGQKVLDTWTNQTYSEVVIDEKYSSRYVLADSDGELIVETINETNEPNEDDVTLEQRVSDLEDAVIELAEIITEGV